MWRMGAQQGHRCLIDKPSLPVGCVEKTYVIVIGKWCFGAGPSASLHLELMYIGRAGSWSVGDLRHNIWRWKEMESLWL